MPFTKAPYKTIERIILYRRILEEQYANGIEYLYSHQLADFTHNTPDQIRRDIMILEYAGTSTKGYEVKSLINCIDEYFDSDKIQKVALVGIGHIGRAILAYFNTQRTKLKIVAGFDNDPLKTNRVISGCRCYNNSELKNVIEEQGISIAVLAVPAESAQCVANLLVDCGIKGFLNFAPIPVKVPGNVFVDRIDITMRLEIIAYFIK